MSDNNNELISCLNCKQQKESTRRFYLDLKDLFNDVNSTKKIKGLFVKVKDMIDVLENLLYCDTNEGKNCNIYLVKFYEFVMNFYIQTEQYQLALDVAVNHLLSSYKYQLKFNKTSIDLKC